MSLIGRVVFAFLMLLALPAGWSAPAAAQETSGEFKEALSALHAEMNSLTLEIENFRVSRRYCKPPLIPSKAEAQAELDELARRAQELNQRYNELKDRLQKFAQYARVGGELLLNDRDPTDERWWRAYEAARRRMSDALARKRAALAAAPEVDCRPKPKAEPAVTVGTTGQTTKPAQPPQPPMPPLPQPPTYEPVQIPVLPKFFCSEQEKLAFMVSISDQSKKASDNATKAGMLKTDVSFDILEYEQAGQPVPPALRALEQRADAEARAHQAQFDALHRLHQQAAAIPVIDCSKATPQQEPPRQDLRTGQTTPQQQPDADPRDPATLQQRIRDASGRHEKARVACDKEGMQAALAELEVLLKEAEQLVRDVEALGGYGTISIEAARDARYAAEKALEVAKMRTPSDCPQSRISGPDRYQTQPPPVRIAPSDRYQTPIPNFVPPQGSVEWRFLNEHNKARAEFGSPPLQWDPALAASASAYAQQMGTLGRVHSSRQARKDVRENLLQSLPGGRTIEQMVGVWADEKRNFVPGTFPNVSRTGNWADIGHYTQVVWPTTTRVGCAVHRGGGYDWTVCHYSPPGNRDGTPIRAGQTMPHPRMMVAQPMPQPRGEVAGGDIAPPNSSTTVRPPRPAGGGMTQIDPPPPPPPPTARDEAPEGKEENHPLNAYFNEASARHATAVDCGDRAAQDAEMAKMRYALEELRKRLKAARRAGPYSAVKPADVQKQIDEMERKLREAEQRRPRGECPPVPPVPPAPQTRGIVSQ